MIAYLTAVALSFSYPGESLTHTWSSSLLLSGPASGSVTLSARPAERQGYLYPWRLYGSYACGQLVGGRYLPRTAEAVHQFAEEVQETCSVNF